MSNAKPGWPDPSALAATLFGANPAAPLAQPLAQGLSGGLDLIQKFWGNLPGGTAVPGFLVPTVDVEELDKRISDLRAAESWLEVNLNVLRATVQGLEVQRHTIAAIRSLSAMGGAAPATKPSTVGGLPAGWPTSVASTPPAPVAAPPVPPPAESPAPPDFASTPPDPEGSEAPAAAAPLAGLAAGNWLGFMQDQFAKVAQAALTTSDVGRNARSDAAPSVKAKQTAAKAPAKKATPRRRAGR